MCLYTTSSTFEFAIQERKRVKARWGRLRAVWEDDQGWHQMPTFPLYKVVLLCGKSGGGGVELSSIHYDYAYTPGLHLSQPMEVKEVDQGFHGYARLMDAKYVAKQHRAGVVLRVLSCEDALLASGYTLGQNVRKGGRLWGVAYTRVVAALYVTQDDWDKAVKSGSPSTGEETV